MFGVAKPKIWLVAYRNDWTYEVTAKAIAEHLGHRFEFRFAYTNEITSGALDEWDFDLAIDFWWHGTIHDRIHRDGRPYGRRVIKQVSSHRWALMKWGQLKPGRMLTMFADDVGAIVVPSLRLLRILQNVASERDDRVVIHCPKGFDPDLFFDLCGRAGELSVGWAGNAESPDKHLNDLLEAEPMIKIADGPGPNALPYNLMNVFYNSLDVIAIASSAEGDPRTVIEGMAAGCFPVTTDVGIVPEIVEHKVNGYIIPVDKRGPETFAQAFAWCRENLDYVRTMGARNAIIMRDERKWSDVMPAWSFAIETALDRAAVSRVG